MSLELNDNAKDKKKYDLDNLFDMESKALMLDSMYGTLSKSIRNPFEKSSFFSSTQGTFKDEVSLSTGLFLPQELVYINPTVYEKKYPSLAFFKGNPTIDNSGGEANTIFSKRSDIVGDFLLGTDQAKNAGQISLRMDSSSIPVYTVSANIEWTYSEILQGKQNNYNVIDKLFTGCLDIYYRQLDEIAITNSKKRVHQSLLYNDFFGLKMDSQGKITLSPNAVTASDAIDRSVTSATSSDYGQTVFSMIKGYIVDQMRIVNYVDDYTVNNCLFSNSLYTALINLPLNQYEVNTNVIQGLKNAFPQINFRTSARLNYDSPNPNDINSYKGKENIILYSDKPECLLFRMPRPLTFGTVVDKSGSWYCHADARVAGVDILQGNSGRVITGV